MSKRPSKGSIGKGFKVCKGKFLQKDFAEGFQGGSPQLTVQTGERHFVLSQYPRVLAERRLNALHLTESNRVAKELSHAFCEQRERER
jgi:hypothetical protein